MSALNQAPIDVHIFDFYGNVFNTVALCIFDKNMGACDSPSQQLTGTDVSILRRIFSRNAQIVFFS
jgi:hypothetical protein